MLVVRIHYGRTTGRTANGRTEDDDDDDGTYDETDDGTDGWTEDG